MSILSERIDQVTGIHRIDWQSAGADSRTNDVQAESNGFDFGNLSSLELSTNYPRTIKFQVQTDQTRNITPMVAPATN